jgi:anti-anti-sigma factor
MDVTSHGVPPKVEDGGNVRILTFAGGPREVENRIAQELDGHTDGLAGFHLLLDFSNVEALGSEELGTLIRLHKQLSAGGGRLTLFNLTPLVYEVLVVTRLHTLLGICREEGKQ